MARSAHRIQTAEVGNDLSTTGGPGVLGRRRGLTGNDGFFQAGTNEPYGYGGGIEASAFTEFFRAGHEKRRLRPDEEPVHTDLVIEPGDQIFALVEWKPAREAILMWVQDLDSKGAAHMEISEPASRVYDGRSVKFMVERLHGTLLQSFGPLAFTEDEALLSGVGWRKIGVLNHLVRVQMRNFEHGQPVGQLMASTGSITSDNKTFVEYWHHCHP